MEFHLPFFNLKFWDEKGSAPPELCKGLDLSFLNLKSRQPENMGFRRCGLARGLVSFALIGYDRYQYTIYCFVRGCDFDTLGPSDDPDATGGGGIPDPITNQVQPLALLECRSEFITALNYRADQVSQSWNTRVCEMKAAINSQVGALRAILPPIQTSLYEPQSQILASADRQ